MLECRQTSGGGDLFLHVASMPFSASILPEDRCTEEDAVWELNSLSSWPEFV